MPRPKCCRRVAGEPACKVFKPVGVPMTVLEEIVLSMDECEAIRLADLEGLYHEEAAGRMGISRQTFGRIVESGRHKMARMLFEGHALRIYGGEVERAGTRNVQCVQCSHSWNAVTGTGRPSNCPSCGGESLQWLKSGRNAEGEGE